MLLNLFVAAQSCKFFSECLRLAGNITWADQMLAKAKSLLEFGRSQFPDFPDFLAFQYREFIEAAIGYYVKTHILRVNKNSIQEPGEMIEEDGFLFSNLDVVFTPYGVEW